MHRNEDFKVLRKNTCRNNRKVFRVSVRAPEFDNSICPISLHRAVSRSISKLTSDLNFETESFLAPLEAHERPSAAAESTFG